MKGAGNFVGEHPLIAAIASAAPPIDKYRGVTRLLDATADKSGLDAWRARVGEEEADRIMNESKEIGNSLDAMFEEALLNPIFDPDTRAGEAGYPLYRQLAPCIRRIEPVGTQVKVWSNTHRYMGYMDCLGIFDGVLSIIDCKNSLREKREEYLESYFLQCTGYALALHEMTGVAVKQLVLPIAVRSSIMPQIEVRPIKPYIGRFLERVKQYHEGQNELQ